MAGRRRKAFQDNIPGGNYTAIQETDGTWTVKDVPIFAELPAGMRENEAKVSTKWMEACLKRHSLLESEGHLPPLHENHHDLGRETPRLGFFRPTHIARLRQEGAEVPALFADLVGLSDASLEKIKNRELPYRSVEIVEWERPELASLALLADESPFFKMEMLSIGDEVAATNINPSPDEVLVAVAEGSGEGAALLFSFKGLTKQGRRMRLRDKLKAKFGSRFQAKDDDKKDDQDDDKKFQDDDNGNKDDNGNGNGKGVDVDGDGEPDIQLQEVTDDVAGQIAAMIAEFQESIPGMIQEYLDGINPLGGTGDALPGETDELIPEPEFDVPPAEAPVDLELEEANDENPFETDDEEEPMRLGGRRGQYRDKEKSMKQFAQMAGRVAALENQNKTRKKAETLTGVVDRAVKILREAGWMVPGSAIKTMRQLARDSRTPGATVKAFAKSYMRHSPKDPAKTLEDLTTQRAGESSDVMKFAARGPEALERARLLGREYTELKDSGFDWSCSMADHIEAHIEGE